MGGVLRGTPWEKGREAAQKGLRRVAGWRLKIKKKHNFFIVFLNIFITFLLKKSKQKKT